MSAKPHFLVLSHVRKFARDRGRRVGADFFIQLDKHIERKLGTACGVHNGSKKTLDATVAGHIGLS